MTVMHGVEAKSECSAQLNEGYEEVGVLLPSRKVDN